MLLYYSGMALRWWRFFPCLEHGNGSLYAALLSPVVDAEVIETEELEEKFENRIIELVHGVLNMEGIRYLKVVQNDSSTPVQMDKMRRMLLANVKDFCCVVVILAERIVHLCELKEWPKNEEVLATKESSNIYALFPHRIGIGQLKWELEDCFFRYLHPDKYKCIAKLLRERRIDREQYIENFVVFLRRAMQEEGLKVDIYGRPKHIYSIWRKMQKKSLDFDELFDVRAVRIVVDRLQDCYVGLGIVHTYFRHLPDEFDDYVANPKLNGYQSIHTVVVGPNEKILEIQIRTRQMHEDAELGLSAHWKYKEGEIMQSCFGSDHCISCFCTSLACPEEMEPLDKVLEGVRSKLFDDRVYIFISKGNLGYRCIDHKISARIVLLTYHPRMGDELEIMTHKYSHPSRGWLHLYLRYVRSHLGRFQIQDWFRRQNREKNIDAGR